MARWCAPLLALGIVSSSAAPAEGQPLARRVRLHMGGNALTSESYTLTVTSDKLAGSDPRLTSLENRELDYSVSSVGIFPNSLGIGAAAALGNSVLFGARVIQGSTKVDIGGTETETSVLDVLPYLEIVPSSPEARLKLFLAVIAGLRGSEGDASKFTSFAYGLSVGMHAFATDSFSIDPSASFLLQSGSLETDRFQADISGSAFLLGVELSGWLGIDPEPPSATDTESDTEQQPESHLIVAESQWKAGGNEGPVVSENRGILSTTLKLGDHLLITAYGNPRTEPVPRVRVSMPEGVLSNCQSLTIEVDGKQLEATNVVAGLQEMGSTKAQVVEGRFPLSTLRTLAEARGEAVLVACEKRWRVGVSQRNKLYSLVLRYEEGLPAEAQGPEPPATPNAADPDSEGGSPPESGGAPTEEEKDEAPPEAPEH